jgi:nucleolar protein 56
MLPTSKFGDRMRVQVEDRLKYLDEGKPTAKNVDCMDEVLEELKTEKMYVTTEKALKRALKNQLKQKKVSTVVEEEVEVEQVEKKKKKKKKQSTEVEKETSIALGTRSRKASGVEEVEKKKKKKVKTE